MPDRANPLSGKGVTGRVQPPILGNISCLSAKLGLVELPSIPRQANPHRSLALDHDKKMVLRAKYADMILVHGGGPGVEPIAAQWENRNGVHQIVCKPDWDRHGRASPFRRNEELLNRLPKGVIAFTGSGITENLVDKARQLGIPFLFPSPVSQRHRHPRARFVLRTTAIGTAGARDRRPGHMPMHFAEHSCIGNRALPVAERSAPPPAQTPRRLRSAGFTGVDLPIFHTARIDYPTGRAGLGFNTRRSGLQGVPWAPMSCLFRAKRGQRASCDCWTECMLWEGDSIPLESLVLFRTCFPEHTRYSPEHTPESPEYTARPTLGRLRYPRCQLPHSGTECSL